MRPVLLIATLLFFQIASVYSSLELEKMTIKQ